MSIKKLYFLTILFFLTVNFATAQPGSLDTSFGIGGKVVEEATGTSTDFFRAIAIQEDGKIVAVGTVNSRFAVYRYNQNGTPDAAFGTNGRVIIDIYPGFPCSAGAVAILPNGKIVAAGSTGKPNSSLVDQTDFAIVRFNPDGSLDNSFGNGNGRIAPNISAIDNAKDIAIQPDGKILLTGEALGRFGSNNYRGTSIFVTRYHTSGATDFSFGASGIAALSFELPNPPIVGSQNSESLALQPDGKIVVAGTANVVGFNGAAVARFLANGQPDTSFDGDGRVYTSDPQEIKSVALQPDGKILIAGSLGGDFAVFRYTTTGASDTSFDGDGRLVTSIESGNDFARDVLIQRNGKIVVVGESAVGADRNFAVARYNADGSFDKSFDGDGKAITDFGGNSVDSISRAALQPDGKIVAAGVSGNKPALARYTGDTPVVRFDFDGDRKADISVFRPLNGFWYRLNSQDNSFFALQFGQSGDKPAPADYDGDGKTDIAVFREGAFGYFYILNSSDNTFRFAQFGTIGDAPVPGDWDGDGRADLAVYRAASTLGAQSYFYYRPSSQPAIDFHTIPLGTLGNKPVAADYDGDGRIDPAVLIATAGGQAAWVILQSSLNQYAQITFGSLTDIPVPADYDGDGRTNVAVFRPSNNTWYTSLNPATNYGAIQFGANGDVPVPADYDGDGRADAAVFRPSNGAWYLNRTTSGFTGVHFGLNSDKPVPNAFVY